jgi:hypothetical protein
LSSSRFHLVNASHDAGQRTAQGRLIEGHTTQGWKQAINALATVFEGRIPEHLL